jgi:hypothetical protein
MWEAMGVVRKARNLNRLVPVPVAYARDLVAKFTNEMMDNGTWGDVIVHFHGPHGTAGAGTKPKPVRFHTANSTCSSANHL